MEQVYMSTDQVCQRYGGVSKRTILEWRQKRGFPLPAYTARSAFYHVSEVLAWEKEHFRMPDLQFTE